MYLNNSLIATPSEGQCWVVQSLNKWPIHQYINKFKQRSPQRVVHYLFIAITRIAPNIHLGLRPYSLKEWGEYQWIIKGISTTKSNPIQQRIAIYLSNESGDQFIGKWLSQIWILTLRIMAPPTVVGAPRKVDGIPYTLPIQDGLWYYF